MKYAWITYWEDGHDFSLTCWKLFEDPQDAMDTLNNLWGEDNKWEWKQIEDNLYQCGEHFVQRLIIERKPDASV